MKELLFECPTCPIMRIYSDVPVRDCPRCGSRLDDVSEFKVFAAWPLGGKIKDAVLQTMTPDQWASIAEHRRQSFRM